MLNESEIEKEIEISVPRAELERLIDDETQHVQKEVAIDGFRKGRVPLTLIKSKYAESLKAQALDRLVRETYLSVVQEKQWHPAAQAELRHVEEGDPMKFQLYVEVIPEFEIDNYRNIEVFKELPMPDDFLLEQGMDVLREQHATVIEVERGAAVDDLVTVDIETGGQGTSDRRTDQTVRIGDRSLPDELNRTLVGAKRSDTRTIEVDGHTHKILIKSVKEKILPEINDDFAARLKVANADELKKTLLEGLRKQEEKRVIEEVKESISEVLLERIRFNVPKTLIQKEYEKILKEYNLPDSDSNRERFWNAAEKRIRFNLILEKIAAQENLHVSEAEILDLVARTGMQLTEHNRNDVIDYLGTILTREKTLNFLYDNAKISTKDRIVTQRR
ncbi:trigger factor [candidate division WOR-3 bacterium]|nr:trigger factor [candidate division WOR-3 bacterium]